MEDSSGLDDEPKLFNESGDITFTVFDPGFARNIVRSNGSISTSPTNNLTDSSMLKSNEHSYSASGASGLELSKKAISGLELPSEAFLSDCIERIIELVPSNCTGTGYQRILHLQYTKFCRLYQPKATWEKIHVRILMA